MTITKYAWRSPIFSKLDAEKCGIELERIRQEHGVIHPDAVVERARDPLSPLHNGFQWDDSEAAKAHRKDQARGLIRAISIVVEKNEDRQEMQRIYVNVQTAETRGYMPIAIVSEYADLSTAVLKRAASDLQAWLDRYKELRDRIPGQFHAVETMLEEIRLKIAA